MRRLGQLERRLCSNRPCNMCPHALVNPQLRLTHHSTTTSCFWATTSMPVCREAQQSWARWPSHQVGHNHTGCGRRSSRHVMASISASSDATIQQQHGSRTSTSATDDAVSLLGWIKSGARVTRAAQATWTEVVRPGDTVVDATCGNGHDALGLARLVGPTGTLYAFDIQAVAVQATRQRLSDELPAHLTPNLHILQQCHTRMQEVVGSQAARCVVFNLGYCPGSDKQLVTQTSTTVQAIEAALEVVQPGGLVSIMLYHGHDEGGREAAVVRQLAAELSTKYWVCTEARLVNRPKAPYLLSIWRMDDADPAITPVLASPP